MKILNARMLLFGLFAYTVLLSVLRIQLYWSVQAWEGDFPFYVGCCTKIPSDEHVTVPIILYSINLFVNNPIAVTFFVSALGYILLFMLVYLGTLQLTGNVLTSVIAFFCFVAMLPQFLTPTAIKNMYGLVFMFLSIILLDKYLKHDTTVLLIPLSLSVLLTAVTHSIPIFPLTIIMSVNIMGAIRKNVPLLILASAGAVIGLMVLQFLGKTVKLIEIVSKFVSAPLQVIGLNIGKYTSLAFPYYLPLKIVLFLIASVIGFATIRQNAMFVGLFLTVIVLLFIGDIEYGERLIENATPLIALFIGYCLNYRNHKGFGRSE